MRVIGERGNVLGTVRSVEHDGVTGALLSFDVRYGLFGRKHARVPAQGVQWVNANSVILKFGATELKGLTQVTGS